MTSELVRWIAMLGHSEVALRSDSKPVRLALQKLAKNASRPSYYVGADRA